MQYACGSLFAFGSNQRRMIGYTQTAAFTRWIAVCRGRDTNVCGRKTVRQFVRASSYASWI